MHTQDFPEMGWLCEETTLKGAPYTPKYFDLQSKHKVATPGFDCHAKMSPVVS